MFDLLDKLRAKPPHARRRIAFLFAGSFTVVIFLFWAVAFTTQPSEGMSVGEVLSPLGGLFRSVSTGKEIATDAFNNIVTEASSSIAAIPPQAGAGQAAATGTEGGEADTEYSGYPGEGRDTPPSYKRGGVEGVHEATTTWR